jgi:bifunctional UDP-N-acetylglucosamine pyrophosphorylase/glucosamine-1-phosphate N-acetyltransferase
VIVMNGDHPLYRASTIAGLRETWEAKQAGLAILVTELPDPHGYGRVLRDGAGRVARVVEENDCSDAERRVREINLGAYCADARTLFELLARVKNDNAKGEFYITDLVELALGSGLSVESATAADWRESLGINTRVELAQAESLLRERIAEQLMHDGVTLTHPATTFVDVDVQIGADTVLAAGVTIRAGSRIGSGCRIDPGVVIEGSVVGNDTHVRLGCLFERGVRVGNRCEIGPNAHLRPGADLRDDVRVGNYVEVKNSVLGKGTKADHLSYIGDADVGEGVTIGCGAITVNYDGAKKTRTTIGDRAFIGCNSNLIAPLSIEPEAYVAAGSTITKSVPGGALAVARGQQRVIEGWRKKRFGDGGHE